MTTLSITLLIIASMLACLCAAWLDARHNWRLVDWFAGKTSNPFKQSVSSASQAELDKKDQQIAQLLERVQVLEQIVTEPAYELNKKLNAL